MTAVYDELTSVLQAVELGLKLPFSWFRGHQEDVGDLTPRFYRKYGDKILREFVPDRELKLIEDFRRDAPAIKGAHSLPREDDTLGWLYLMQHYEAPTRLLDWTQNVLAAVFFAVSDTAKWKNADGELWALAPHRLNLKAGVGSVMPLYDRNPVTDYLAEEPYWNNHQALANEIAERYKGRASEQWCADPEPFKRPVAFEPRRDFPRMLVQLSVFTIHPQPSGGNTIPELLTGEEELVRYRIPKEFKQKLYMELGDLGMTHRTLFPDFSGLSRTVAPGAERIASGPLPKPPRWTEHGAGGAAGGLSAAREPARGEG